ncbi:hypothetical protein RCL_jg26618.t1 [Rhizophagus clarus]|uniref:Uncharacterized protein n=1 Tax=Rhizophagus clarus TaxID=94130 RepID=A0A8H3LIQ1_9GLOM|nr:hypothetical protein RCL_jg26618.t1 [Rhizophagus clarus]
MSYSGLLSPTFLRHFILEGLEILYFVVCSNENQLISTIFFISIYPNKFAKNTAKRLSTRNSQLNVYLRR